MIDYLSENNYPFPLPSSPSNNPNNIFDASYFKSFKRMEKENPDISEKSNTSDVPVESTEAASSTSCVEIHPRTCLCCDCQEKYGSLPLFAQVLDSHHQQDIVVADNSETAQPQPSTSRQSPTPTKQQPFQCDTCQKRFSHRGDYHKHVRIHSGDKPYACAHCPLRFAHPSNRARHLRSHSSERPYRCSVCNRNFYRKDKLDRHRMSNKCRKKMNETGEMRN